MKAKSSNQALEALNKIGFPCENCSRLITSPLGSIGLRAGARVETRRRFIPMRAQARALKAAASKAKTPADLLKIPEIQPALLTAAGGSPGVRLDTANNPPPCRSKERSVYAAGLGGGRGRAA
jgi:hypothetical protein